MHIPDHILDPSVCVVAGAASAATVGYALHRVRLDLRDRTKAAIAVTAACIFAGQMLNFPIDGNTSGHFVGGALAGILLGPWAGVVTLTIVLVVQCLLFQDGGLFALSANTLNMAVIGVLLGYIVFAGLRRYLHGTAGELLSAAFASWISVVGAAALCSVELSVGAPFPVSSILAVMLPTHSLVGVGEAILTSSAIGCVSLAHPGIFGERTSMDMTPAASRKRLAYGFTLAVLMSAILSPFASNLPDGLEASFQAVAPAAKFGEAMFWTPLAEYSMVGLQEFAIAGSFTGLLGVVAVVAFSLGLFRLGDVIDHPRAGFVELNADSE